MGTWPEDFPRQHRPVQETHSKGAQVPRNRKSTSLEASLLALAREQGGIFCIKAIFEQWSKRIEGRICDYALNSPRRLASDRALAHARER
jgi:hypothetical protein